MNLQALPEDPGTDPARESSMRHLLASLLVLLAAEAEAQPPDILLILADDCTWNDLPIYGGRNARTPHLDRLAGEGLVFDRAFLSSAMCQPCRAELYTGLYPMSNGCVWNHSASRPETRSVPHFLDPGGYRCGLAGKVHVKPEASFPFETVAGFDPSCVRNPTRPHDLQDLENFISRDRQGPFFLAVALVEPHVPWVMGDASRYPPESLELPPNIADTTTTREAFSRYLAEITHMDAQVGDILDVLERSGRADDTLVLFTSEQGSQFPGCKWTNWNTGIHTALIARWPDRVAPGGRTTALVQYADILPTLLEAAGGDPAAGDFDGTSFLEVLLGRRESHREFAFGMHNNVPEGPSYPIRSVTDGTWHYIRNLKPDEIYIEKHLMGWSGRGELKNPYWHTWVAQAWNRPGIHRLVGRYMNRPGEELYHLGRDPYELDNLAGVAEHQAIRDRLSETLRQWRTAQGDPGAPLDTLQALRAARSGRHLHHPRN